MDNDQPDPGGKVNICPICGKGFKSVAGLKQHWTKSHSDDEIKLAIAGSSQTLPRDQQSQEKDWNKFQIIKDDGHLGSIQCSFNIIENSASGDCLFLAILQFLRSPEQTFINVPADHHELRRSAVEHITMETNFTRFMNTVVEDIQQRFPDSDITLDSPVNAIKTKYMSYMSTAGEFGTIAELCALAELFKFVFCVIRQDNHTEYACYDYCSTVAAKFDNTMKTMYLLFTGSTNSGQFRALIPISDMAGTKTQFGKYKLVNEYTSSKITSISLGTHSQNLKDNSRRKDSFPSGSDVEMDETDRTSFDEFVYLLARCKRNIKVLKRIPRGARVAAANSLSTTIDECLAHPESTEKWKSLLTFVYMSLQVPDRTKNVSLATSVKRNIGNPSLVFKRRPKNKVSISISKRVEYKIAEGDVKGAVKILSSYDTLAPQTPETLEQLKQKHPPPLKPFRFPEPPDEHINPLVVSEKDVVKNINSFPNGSASGVDGILPQHLKDLTAPYTGQAGLKLIKSVTNLSNFMLAGKIPNRLCAVMYGASLCALNKEGGSVRPIAVGNTFRRLTAKLASASVLSKMSSKFSPRQVGYGTRGGCEAAAHATRTFVKKNRRKAAVVLKIDFRNTFNELDRDRFLCEMRTDCPEIYPFLWQCYSTSTLLFYGEDTIWSQNGAQQGDPCGPLLFCSAIQLVLVALISEFVVFYLDDGTIAGSYESVLKDFETIITECGKMGLQINPTKCEIYFCSEVDQEIAERFDHLSPGIIVVNELTLLGAPSTDNAFTDIFAKKVRQLKLLFGRLVDLDNYQIAYYMLKNCLSVPKLVFLLRTSPTWNHKELLEEMDEGIKSTLETITNSKLQHDQWILASLPIRCGGLGVRRVQDLALPAFLSSVHGLSSMVGIMLNLPAIAVKDIASYTDAINAWQVNNIGTNQPERPHSQKQWDTIDINRLYNELQFDTEEEVARIMAAQKPESGAWLHALPSRNIGTLVENNSS